MTIKEAHDIVENKLRCEQTWNTNRCRADCKECPYFCDYDATIKAYGVAIKALELIPDNATNGDMIKALFNNSLDDFKHTWGGGTITDDWWNAPYKKEGAE